MIGHGFNMIFTSFAGFVSLEGFERISQTEKPWSGLRSNLASIFMLYIRIRGGRNVADRDFFGVGIGYGTPTSRFP